MKQHIHKVHVKLILILHKDGFLQHQVDIVYHVNNHHYIWVDNVHVVNYIVNLNVILIQIVYGKVKHAIRHHVIILQVNIHVVLIQDVNGLI